MTRSASILALLLIVGCGGDDVTPIDAGGGDAPSADASRDSGGETQEVVILRDTYGVPHVFADDLYGAAVGWGYSFAEDLGPQALGPFYGSRGTAARVFGRDCHAVDCAGLDAFSLSFGVPEVVDAQYASLAETTREAIEGYAVGMNRYFEELAVPAPEFVEPVTPQMVAGMMHRVQIAGALAQAQTQFGSAATEGRPDASNQFAATGSRTVTGTALMGSDPHSPWGGFRREPHVHLRFGDQSVFGLTAFAGPQVECGGNASVHHGCTSLLSAATAVRVAADVNPEGTAYFDHRTGGFVPFETQMIAIEIAGEPDITFTQLLTRWGPVRELEGGQAIAAHVFIADDLSSLDYLVGRMLARNADEFLDLWNRERSGEVGQNRAFAAGEGRVGYVYGAQLPVLDDTVDWSMPVSSADPRIEWEPEQWYNIDGVAPELPHVIDPVGDFVQNCNGHPNFATEPPGQVGAVPIHVRNAGGPTSRGRRMRQLLIASSGMDLDDAEGIMTDLYSADGENLVEAIRRGLAAEGITDPSALWSTDAVSLLELLLAWRDDDAYQFTVDSEAATVLTLINRIPGISLPGPDVTFDRAQLDAVATVLDAVAATMRMVYASQTDPLRIEWGFVNRVMIDGREIGLPGAPGGLTLIVSNGQLEADGRYDPDPNTRHGSVFTRVARLDSSGLEVRISVPRGQISADVHPTSSHLGQTIDDFAALRLRRVWLDRAEIESNLCPFADDPGHEHAAETRLDVAPR